VAVATETVTLDIKQSCQRALKTSHEGAD